MDTKFSLSINQEKQMMMNRSLVIELLRQERLCSRADLARLSGLKRATITNIINEFIECGLVVEDGLLEGDKGRRSIGIRINGERYSTIGVMLTRNSYSISLMGLSGEVYEVRNFKIKETVEVKEIIDNVKENIHKLIEENSDSSILAIGFAMPGPYKIDAGEMIFVTNQIGWEGISVNVIMQEGFDIPVFIENDANAGAVAQLWFRGKKTEQKNIVYIVAGQGIGCGIISDGELMKGSAGIAGEIGHVSINYQGPKCDCGSRGCLEKYCSAIILKENLNTRIKNNDTVFLKEGFTLNDVIVAINKGDKAVIEEYSSMCRFLAIGIVNMINQINPGTVIIGDVLTDINPQMLLEIINDNVKKTVRPYIWENLTIEINKITDNPIMIGAGAIAAQKVFENPFVYVKS